MCRVLMVGPDRSVHGGISGVVNNYYKAGLDAEIDLCYIGTMKEGTKPYKLLTALKAYLQFKRKLPLFDIVHIHMASDSSYVRKSFFVKAAKKAGKKIVIHQHGGDFETYYASLSARRQAAVRKVLSMGDAFLVLAPYLKVFFGKLIGEEKITVFPDAIAMPEPLEQNQKKYGSQKILFLGRICKEKGIRELLQAMKNLHETYPDAKLYLGGIYEDAALEEEVKEQAPYVENAGWVTGKEKEALLQACDLFVLPSYFEGQSVAILEAMAHGCAVAASDVGGIPMMIEPEETGLLFQPKDAESLQAALGRLLSDASLCEKLGNAAREKVKKEFSMEKNIEELLSIYRRFRRTKGK